MRIDVTSRDVKPGSQIELSDFLIRNKEYERLTLKSLYNIRRRHLQALRLHAKETNTQAAKRKRGIKVEEPYCETV